ncbi:hypothetical protein [Robiginitomaculum antarcticum]|uniref:hypothetical protein n=1 Tax=Robiginitomaculum antarcticum TaxID=437507 RepID=UPI000377F2B8|nr:hypothetical protein [Robiginitomaculum antarcticum]
MSTVKVSGSAIFQHTETGETLEISADDLQITSDGSSSGGMGPDILWRIYAELEEIEYLDWTVSEYPVGILNLPATLTLYGDYAMVKDNIAIELNHVETDDDLDDEDWDSAIKQMVDWFLAHYEDPAESVSYESAEGGYQWGGRGPYRAIEVLSDEFPEYSESLHEISASQLEEDGTVDWAIQFHAMDDQEPDDEEEQLFEPSGRSDTPMLMPKYEIPPQEPGGIIFAINGEGKIDLAKSADIPNITGSGLVFTNLENNLWDKIQEISVKLSAALFGSNALPNLAQKVSEYNQVAVAEERSISALYVEGALVRSQTYRDMVRLDSGEGPDGVAEDLEDLLELHSNLIGVSTIGKSLLEGAHNHAKMDAEIKVYKKETLAFIEGTLVNSELVTPEAAQALRSVIEFAGEAPDPNVSAQIAQTSGSNFVKALALLLKGGFLGAGAMIIGPIIQQSLVGAEAIQSGIIALNFATAWLALNLPALQSLVGVIGPDAHWLQAFQNWLNWYEDTH